MKEADIHIEKKPNGTARLFFISGAIVTSFIFSLICFLKNLPILPQGPTLAISEVTKSLWESGSLVPKYFQITYEEAAAHSKMTSSVVWQDVFAIDPNGKLLPKHSLISSLVAVPFFALLGNYGFWILQQLIFLWLLYSSYLVSEELTHKNLPWTTLLSTCLLSPTIFYTYEFSYDLHGCALLIGGLCMMRNLPLIGGMVMCLSVFVRPAYFLLVIPLAFARNNSLRATQTRDSLIGVIAISLLFLLTNYTLWGNPLLTGYSRLPSFQNGEIILSPHPIGFDFNIFISDWSEKIFSSKGIIPYNLAFIALPFVLASIWNHKEHRFQIISLLSAFVYSLYIFSYPMWMVTTYGNRFLLPANYLYLFSFIAVTGRLEIWRKSKVNIS